MGPRPIAIDKLTEDKLVEALQYMTKPSAKQAAKVISARMQEVRFGLGLRVEGSLCAAQTRASELWF